MKTLLIVDDETLFTQSLAEGLRTATPSLRVLTAADGLAAIEHLEREPVDLVLTDLKMPRMDGFQLLSVLSSRFPATPVLVMTAFGTPEIGKRLRDLGVDSFVEKPVDFNALSERIDAALSSGASGFMKGITLPTFLQVLEMERKTCAVRVTARGRTGILRFVGGELWDAEAGSLAGEQAAVEIVRWEGSSIEILSGPRPARRHVFHPVTHLLLESLRIQDEARAGVVRKVETQEARAGSGPTPEPHEKKEDRTMAINDKLKELAGLEGFAGVGVFTPTGEQLALVTAGSGFTKEIGILANNVLMNAQKASLEMGTGRGQQVHVEAERAHIIVRCLNEGTDPLKSQPGKAHIHLVLALTNDSALGLAKMRVNSTIEKLGEEFRM